MFSQIDVSCMYSPTGHHGAESQERRKNALTLVTSAETALDWHLPISLGGPPGSSRGLEAPFYRSTHAYEGGSCETAQLRPHRPCCQQIVALWGGFWPLVGIFPSLTERGGVTKLQYYYSTCACNPTLVGNP